MGIASWGSEAYRQRAIADAMAECRWKTVLWLTERPRRVLVFCEFAPAMTDQEYWMLLRWIWEDSENIYQWRDLPRSLLLRPRPDRDLMMTPEERAALAAMPGVLTVYRGYDRRNMRGWSWTTDAARAEWFARRFSVIHGSHPRIAVWKIIKQDVIAYLTGRRESEIVADPSRVDVIRTRRVEASPQDQGSRLLLSDAARSEVPTLALALKGPTLSETGCRLHDAPGTRASCCTTAAQTGRTAFAMARTRQFSKEF